MRSNTEFAILPRSQSQLPAIFVCSKNRFSLLHAKKKKLGVETGNEATYLLCLNYATYSTVWPGQDVPIMPKAVRA